METVGRTIDRDTSWAVVDAVRTEVADLLDDLAPQQKEQPSLCEAWTVRDVGAHLSMAALAPTGFVVRQALRQGFRFDPMIREGTLAWSRGLTDAEVTANLRGLVGVRRLAPSTMWRDPLIDALVHRHDIADPLGIRLAPHVEAAATAADWAWTRTLGFPFLPWLRLRGLRLVATDAPWTPGQRRGGPRPGHLAAPALHRPPHLLPGPRGPGRRPRPRPPPRLTRGGAPSPGRHPSAGPAEVEVVRLPDEVRPPLAVPHEHADERRRGLAVGATASVSASPSSRSPSSRSTSARTTSWSASCCSTRRERRGAERRRSS